MPAASLSLIARDDASVTTLHCPGPGRVRISRRVGEVLVPGSELGVLVRDELSFSLVVPHGARGQIDAVHDPSPWQIRAHGDPLATLVTATAEAIQATDLDESRQSSDGWELRASSHGTFYRRPSPDAPPYVRVGDTVEAGTTIGLVEVMKCFSPIAFTPPPGVSSAVVEDVLVEDGVEVQADQPLLVLKLS
jgi:acetyl-CoA carboxylase biotin carboxyl carrier protein